MSEEVQMGTIGDPASPNPPGATTTRRCSNCSEWYDARASSCYFCNSEEREHNIALKKAAEATRLNSALASQMGHIRAEASAEQTLKSARADRTGESFARARPRVEGYGDLVDGIKNSLEEHPEVLDFMAGQ